MSSAPAQPAYLWSGIQLGEAFGHAAKWLDANHEQINALNVFPVPDGDTGTNMAMTMRAAVEAIKPDEYRASEVARHIAYGALLGARGNSGVILSQIFRGFANGLLNRDELDGRDLAIALDGAREMAYKAVMRPVEGTMLTVIRGSSERALEASQRTPALLAVLQEAIAGARETLAATPTMLEILRQAGVVDAGGQGIVVILEGLERYATGNLSIEPDQVFDQGIGAGMAFLDQVGETHGDDDFGYCTNFMVFGEDIPFDLVRDRFAGMGQSAVIVGDETMVKVHIHTENPGEVLQYALSLGHLDQIKIDNMSLQTGALTDQRTAARDRSVPEAPEVIGDIAVIAVAPGDGIAGALQSMGATGIVRGGQTMNPSTQDLLAAVEAAPADQVVILPNNKNIILAANQVPGLTTRTVRIVPTRSVPQALAALAAFNPHDAIDTNIEAMTGALDAVTSLEITRAVRDVELNGVRISQGQIIGLMDNELVASTDSVTATAETLFRLSDRDAAELVTVFSGADATGADIAGVESAVTIAWPDAEVDIQQGGQPHYLFIISVE